ncbi:hypothetical protein BDR07DRAFT_1458431 [Suillus spraguei]|nr:hypothetical protein BDR07DRAFT_1458431 [Suillus spraguei]
MYYMGGVRGGLGLGDSHVHNLNALAELDEPDVPLDGSSAGVGPLIVWQFSSDESENDGAVDEWCKYWVGSKACLESRRNFLPNKAMHQQQSTASRLLRYLFGRHPWGRFGIKAASAAKREVYSFDPVASKPAVDVHVFELWLMGSSAQRSALAQQH